MKKAGAQKKAGAKQKAGGKLKLQNSYGLKSAYNAMAGLISEYEDIQLGRERFAKVKDGNISSDEKKEILKKKIEAKELCSICIDKFVSDVDFAVLVCGHCYHENCILMWLNTHDICPMCRAYVK